MGSRPSLMLLWALTFASCAKPGVRSEGRGGASWEGSPHTSWEGDCVYDVQTRWASTLPHVIRLMSDDGRWSVVVSSSRSFARGRSELRPTGQGGVQGLVMDGATVRGALLGTLEWSTTPDSTLVTVVGTKVYRDTVGFRASCRLSP